MDIRDSVTFALFADLFQNNEFKGMNLSSEIDPESALCLLSLGEENTQTHGYLCVRVFERVINCGSEKKELFLIQDRVYVWVKDNVNTFCEKAKSLFLDLTCMYFAMQESRPKLSQETEPALPLKRESQPYTNVGTSQKEELYDKPNNPKASDVSSEKQAPQETIDAKKPDSLQNKFAEKITAAQDFQNKFRAKVCPTGTDELLKNFPPSFLAKAAAPLLGVDRKLQMSSEELETLKKDVVKKIKKEFMFWLHPDRVKDASDTQELFTWFGSLQDLIEAEEK